MLSGSLEGVMAEGCLVGSVSMYGGGGGGLTVRGGDGLEARTEGVLRKVQQSPLGSVVG